ncbi:MAG: bifunctional phosphoribosylaminoimidazolecarboxamide formyltransferase/IMP cyclohydrolase, partial [Thermoplasmata archaeon]
AIIKHNNPCGVAISSNINESYIMAYEADKISAYGGIIGLNRPLEIDFAQRLRGVFYELIVAPDFSKEALEFFSKYKKDMRVVKFYGELSRISVRSSSGGYLVQDTINENFEIKYVTKRRPSDKEMEDLLFAWKVVKHVRSNAIVIAKNGVSVGIGAGQMSRIDAVKVAVMKAGERSKGAVLASDAFFPFSDDIEEAASAGISAIIQPGGSKRDEEVIRAAEKYDIAMVFTGIRVFKH